MSFADTPIKTHAHPGANTQPVENPLLWGAEPSGAWTWVSPEWVAGTGLTTDLSLGWGWLSALHALDRPAVLAGWDAARRSGTFLVEARLQSTFGTVPQPVRLFASSRRGPDGEILGWAGVVLKLDAKLDEARALPAEEELQRQIRDTLAVIRSVARRTARTSDTIEHYATHFEGRLDALARVQSASIRMPDGGVDLDALVAEEMVAHRVEDSRVTIEGPFVRLHAMAADVLGLALHELVINAIKFGALGSSVGTVSVRWTVDASRTPAHLEIAWHERGVSVAAPAPRRKGFGSELIEKSLPYQLNAVTSLDFLPGGLRCVIAVPLSGRIVLAGPSVPMP